MTTSWQEVLDKIIYFSTLQSTLKSFIKLETDVQRIEFCMKDDLINSSLVAWLETHTFKNEISKSAKLAVQHKNEGNKAYTQGKDVQALKSYSQGLLYATQTESALLFGNRSAVQYRKNNFTDCLSDIDVAIDNGFPREKVWKLYVRKGEALYHLERYKESIKALKQALVYLANDSIEQCNKIKELHRDVTYKYNAVLNRNQRSDGEQKQNEGEQIILTSEIDGLKDLNDVYLGSNTKLPNASSCLSLKYSEHEGRHLVASKDLPEGSIIISEHPYAAVLLPQWFDTHCQHCYQLIHLLYPCKQCIEVRYCSDDCRKASWDMYHYFECGKLKLLEQIGIAHLSLRIILLTPTEELLKKRKPRIENPYLNVYESVYNLVTHSDEMITEDFLSYSVTATLLYQLLIFGKYFEYKCIPSESKLFIGGLLLRHILQLVCNAHAITRLNYSSSIATNIVEQDQVRIATAIYPTTSLLNHSCEPSIINCFKNADQLIVKLVKPVKKGEQIYNCYGPHYRRMEFTDRQDVLKQQYFFQCKCEHCLKGYNIEDVFNCYCCPTCKHPITGTKLLCLPCDVQLSVESIERKEKQSLLYFEEGLKVLNSDPSSTGIRKSLEHFKQCLLIQEEICYKYHSKISRSYDVIAKCLAMLRNYKKSIKYLNKSYAIVERQYGSQSIELTNEIIKMSDIYVELIKEMSDNSVHQLLADGVVILKHGLKLVELNKEPNSEEAKELNDKVVFLEKALKQ